MLSIAASVLKGSKGEEEESYYLPKVRLKSVIALVMSFIKERSIIVLFNTIYHFLVRWL